MSDLYYLSRKGQRWWTKNSKADLFAYVYNPYNHRIDRREVVPEGGRLVFLAINTTWIRVMS